MIAGLLHFNLIYAIGMMLVHSIWQLALVYLVMQLVLTSLGPTASTVKYRVAIFSMLSGLVLAGITFIVYYKAENKDLAGIARLLPMNETTVIPHPVADPGRIQSDYGTERLRPYLPGLVTVYLTGLVIMCFRIIMGSVYMHRHARLGVSTPSGDVSAAFQALCRRVGVKQAVRLLESVIIRVPEVLGYFRPLIIVPAGFFADMPFDQAEAILSHELAHIKRKDFLFNIFQSVIEMLFFYHPAIYLISARIRDERENCCDDMALASCPGKVTYAKALANMAENQLKPSYPAVALVSGRRNLLDRIKRILNHEHMKTKISDKLLAGVIILAGFGIIIITGAAAMNKLSIKGNDQGKDFSFNLLHSPNGNTTASDSLITVDERTVVIKQDDKKGKSHTYEMEFKNEKLDKLKVDGKNISASKFKDYEDVIQKTLDSLRADAEKDEMSSDDMQKNGMKKIRIEIEDARDSLSHSDTAAINKKIRIAIVDMDQGKKHADNEKMRLETKKIELDSLSLLLNSKLSEQKMKEIQVEIQRAKKDMDKDKFLLELNGNHVFMIHPGSDSMVVIMDKAASEFDQNKFHNHVFFSPDSLDSNDSFQLNEMNFDEIEKNFEDIDWDKTMSFSATGMNPLRVLIADSSHVFISHPDLQQLEEQLQRALESVERINNENISRKLEESQKHLEKAQQNLENTLLELEKDKKKEKEKK